MPRKTLQRPAPRGADVLQLVLLAVPAAFIVSTFPGVRPGDGYDLLLDGVLNNLAYESAAAVCLLRAVRARSRAGLLLGAGLAVYGSGNVFWTVFLRPLAEQPFPSGADALFLTFYPLAFAALILLAKHRDARHARSLWLDGVVAGLAVSAIAAAAFIEPIIGAGGRSWAAVATTTAYPLLDLVLLLVVAGVLSIFGWRPPVGLWLLTAGLTLFVVADVAYLFSTANGTYESGGLTDGFWVLAVVLMGLTPGWPSAPTGLRLPNWALLTIPVGATTSSLVVLVFDHGYRLHPAAIALAALTVASALARLLLTFGEVNKLAESRELALTDELTGLGNRRALYRDAPTAIGDQAPGTAVALLLLDLDRFKEVNDSLGHHAGDALLRGISARLRSVCPDSGAVVARLGGDEFAVLVVDHAVDRASGLAARVHAALAEPLDVDGLPVRARVSIGVAVLPAAEAELSTMLRQADVAMYHAKTGRLGTFVYSPDVDEFVSGDRIVTAEALRSAIVERTLVLHYQPKVDVATGRVDGVEALVRWEHPDRGLLLPGAFLPLVEGAGLMDELTRAVLEQALDQARTWYRDGRPLAVAVNLSASSLTDRELPDRITAMLAARRLPPHLLEIEITEDFLMADPGRARTVLDGLRTRGVRIAVDDYGTGYSSLAYLRQLPVDDLKLDRSFMQDLTADPRALAIVRSTIMLAHSLGLRLVAEGVEDEATARELAEAGCDVLQGWFYARALPAAELTRWLDDRTAAAASLPAQPSLPVQPALPVRTTGPVGTGVHR